VASCGIRHLPVGVNDGSGIASAHGKRRPSAIGRPRRHGNFAIIVFQANNFTDDRENICRKTICSESETIPKRRFHFALPGSHPVLLRLIQACLAISLWTVDFGTCFKFRLTVS
jgi:hypothetical protein